jgi:hypothetical protein
MEMKGVFLACGEGCGKPVNNLAKALTFNENKRFLTVLQ